MLASLAPSAPPPDVAGELARLVRIAWHFELRAIESSRTVAVLQDEVVAVRAKMEAQRRRGDVEEARALAAEKQAVEAEDARQDAVDDIEAFKQTRRYRLVARLTRVTDRVRAR